MKKGLLIIILTAVLTSCEVKVSVFDKFNYMGLEAAFLDTSVSYSVNTENGDLRTLNLSEFHDDGDGIFTEMLIDLDSIQFSSYTGGDESGSWGLMPSPESQSGEPIYGVTHLMAILFSQDLTLAGSGSFTDSFSGETYTLDYVGSYVDNFSFPSGPVTINGEGLDSFDTSMFPEGIGELIQIEFDIESDNDFIDGKGVVLLSNSQPNGMLYLLYDHSTDYKSVVMMDYGSGSDLLFFAAPYSADYTWWMVRDDYDF